MSVLVPTSAWRVDNAEQLRRALCLLRLRLHRHARDLGVATESRRSADWIVAFEDAAVVRSAPADGEVALEAELEQRGVPALRSIAVLAELSDFEVMVLLLAAAPSLDGAFAHAYAELNDDSRCSSATLHLALSLFLQSGSERLIAADCMLPSRALRSFRLVEVDEGDRDPLIARRLRTDERVSNYLRGVNRIDARVATLVRPLRASLPSASASVAGAEAAVLVSSATGQWPTINLIGDGDGARETARLACASLQLQPVLLDLRRFAACDMTERGQLKSLFGRESLLAGMALVVDASDVEAGGAFAAAIDELIETVSSALFVISAERWPSEVSLPLVRIARPSRLEQRALWRAALEPHAHSVNGEVDVIAQQFDFSASSIEDVVSRVATREGEITGRSLWDGCREQTGASLDELARKIEPGYGWSDIVVSRDVEAQLHDLSDQVQHRARVYESWGFAGQLGRGRGITALFAGPSGTGKTMAAEILAGDLRLDLYRIDLAGIVNKYIGETEKNLRRVFDAAERSGAILFFDEADALFGNRTEVRDSHDRYANLEVNYLLQRMEDYSGLAILATNRRTSLDAAFLRRLRFVIDFPFPSAEDRRRIWERVFPVQAELEPLDLSLLSGFDISGGNIRSIAVNAAFLAAAERSRICMPHVMRAAAREFAKLSKPIHPAEFGSYFSMARP